MPAFLIELGCEELPANACDAAVAQAGAIVERLLRERRLAPSAVRTYVAPRRIAVWPTTCRQARRRSGSSTVGRPSAWPSTRPGRRRRRERGSPGATG